MADQEDHNYVLFHNETSICSLMVRYCFALRGTPKDPANDIRMKEKSIDIYHDEQLTEHFLCDINADGEVPVLAPLPLHDTIPDSLKITLYLSRYYPNIIPTSHDREIRDLLAELHRINYYSLTFTGKPETVNEIQEALRKRLDGQISERYHQAIEHKLAHMKDSRVHAIEPAAVEHNRQLTLSLMEKLEANLSRSQTDWLFGLDHPCGLDAHVIVFIARMIEVNREDLIPKAVQSYALKAMDGDEWHQVVPTGSTKPLV